MHSRPVTPLFRVAAMALLFLPGIAAGQSPASLPFHARSLTETAADGAWSELAGPEGASGAIYDPVRDRLVVLVGTDVWALPLGSAPAWERLRATGAPSTLGGFEVAYDPPRDRILIFGGTSGFDYSNEVWALSLANLSWNRLTPAGPAPAGRSGAAWIYDPVRDRMITFGGLGFPNPPQGPYFNDVWALSLEGDGAWTEILPAGDLPYERPGHGAIYDPVRDRLVISGGLATIMFDAWALTLAGTPTWTRLTPSGATPEWRFGYASVYDPNGDRLVIHGGRTFISGPSSFLEDTWALPLGAADAWSRLADQQPMPSPRADHVAIYDPIRARMLIYGGTGPGGTPPLFARNEAWALSLTGTEAWSFLLQAARPSVRAAAAGAFDARLERFIVFGGTDGPMGSNNTWAFPLRSAAGWSPVAPGGELPPPRAGASAIYDPVRNRVVIFGGNDNRLYLNDTWALSLDDPPHWMRLEPQGDPPGVRASHGAIYDPVRDRMIVHGGYRYDQSYENYGDTWALSLVDPPIWTRLSSTGPAGPGRSLVYDARSDRAIAFGGGSSPIFQQPPGNDTWALPLAAPAGWTLLTPAGPLPPARGGHSAVYDAGRERMVVFGGFDASNQGMDDSWELSLGAALAWRRLSPEGGPPPARAGQAAIFDPGGDRMLIFGGTGGDFGFGRNDTWALTFDSRSLEVTIDVRPGDRDNVISLHSRGMVPLAVFGSPALDVSTIDLASIRLAGAPVAEAGGRTSSRLEDLNGDGALDLVVLIDAEAMVFEPGATTVEFAGQTQDGTVLHGSDTVRLVPRDVVRSHVAGSDVSAAGPRVDVYYLAPGRPLIQLTLAASEVPARLEALAVDGRRVWSKEVSPGAASPVTIDFGGVRALGPGVYWLRVTQGRDEIVARKFVLAE